MGEIIIKSRDVEICTEAFGKPDNPAVLLIMGATASMIWWDTEFCQRLSDKGYFVIRYDNRDVGRSTVCEPKKINYTFMDMVDDAIAVLDYYKIQKAHLAGMSLGGMIAQVAALKYSERVHTITCFASGIWDDDPDLPQIDQRVIEFQSKAFAEVDWNNKQSVTDYLVCGLKILSGSRYQFDEERNYRLAESEFERANNLLSMFNHALLQGGEEYYGKVNEITVPVLIIHGTEDMVLPYPHALAIKKVLPGSTLIALEGAGHELHYDDWDLIIDNMVQHFRK